MIVAVRRVWFAVLLLCGFAMHAPGLSAQTLTVTTTAADTVAIDTDLGTTSTFVLTLQVSVSGCAAGANCNVYISAVPGGTSTVSNLRWSTQSATCATSSTAVLNSSIPNTAGTAIYSLTGSTTGRGANQVFASGNTTVYVCGDASLTWSTAPTRMPYTMYFTVIRQ